MDNPKTQGPVSQPREAIFPSFFMGGFDGSTQIDRSGHRRDWVMLTQHDTQYCQDYQLAEQAGLKVIREELRWYLIEKDGHYDFSSIEPMILAAEELDLTQIICPFHYGTPEGLSPLDADFIPRFRDYCAAFAAWRKERASTQRWYAVINEPSMYTYAAASAAWFYPFESHKEAEFKQMLVMACIAATDAIRSEDPQARFIAIDPVIHFVPPQNTPEEKQGLPSAMNAGQYEFWDMLMGRQKPELGGGPEYMDAIGINHYPFSQREVGGERDVELSLSDPRRRPFSEILKEVDQRYRKPVVMTECSAVGDMRPAWIRSVVDECLSALRQGVDLQGICIFPLVDMQTWHGGVVGDWGQLGLWDIQPEGALLKRILNEPYYRALEQARQAAEASGLLPA